MVTFPRGRGLTEYAIFGVLLEQSSDLEALGVSDRCLFQMLTFFLGIVSRVYVVPLSRKDLGESLHVLPLPGLCVLFYKR